MKKIKTIKEYGEFLFDYWKWVKKHWDNTDWDLMVQEAGALIKKYPEVHTRSIILGFMADKSESGI